MPPPRRSWRPGLRAQPARPPRFAADTTSSHLRVRGSPGNYGQSHRCTRRTVSVAEVCGTATPALLCLRATSGTLVVCCSARYGEGVHRWMLKKRMFGCRAASSINSVSPQIPASAWSGECVPIYPAVENRQYCRSSWAKCPTCRTLRAVLPLQLRQVSDMPDLAL
jgi:hypothetical protein